MLVRPNIWLGNAGRLMSEIEVNMSPERATASATGAELRGKPGAILGAERLAQGLSIDQVADQLKLAPRQITALESDNYEALPGMAIVRGFVRAYAKYLRLDAAPLVAMITVDNGLIAEVTPMRREMATPFAETQMPSMSRRNMTPVWVLGSAFVLCVIVVLAWLQFSDRFPSGIVGAGKGSPTTTILPSPIPAQASSNEGVTASAPIASASIDTTSGSAAPAVADSAAATPAVAPSTAPVNPPALASANTTSNNTAPVTTTAQEKPAAENPVAASNNLLILKIKQDSWVEVKRSNGTVLLSRVLKAGNSEAIDMSNPVQLVVGNVAGVDANLRGQPLLLKNGTGNTARVNLK